MFMYVCGGWLYLHTKLPRLVRHFGFNPGQANGFESPPEM